MGQFLVFRLYGPMASWGEIAVGEDRHSALYPSRSALLGLLGAALGIERDDDARQTALTNSYLFGVKLHNSGYLLRDYHTIQRGPELKKLRYRTRRQEVTLVPRDQLTTLLTTREYVCDSFATVAVVAQADAFHSLAEVVAALQKPVFPLYLGRKSCPLALPLAAKVAEFADLKAALDAFDADPLPELVAHVKEQWRDERRQASLRRLRLGSARYYWDDALGAQGLSADLRPSLTLHRHDQPLSRRRWQFAPRREHLFLSEPSP